MDGFFNQNGHPIVPIEVYGFSDKISQKFDAMLDTGFSGFLSLPLVYALKVGLILNSTASFVLADGSVQNTLLCLGTVKIKSEEQAGLISISKGNDVLLGMDFLRKVRKKLHIDCEKRIVRLE
jgi:predicted aspartyl protease